jgi:hypothetical protein
MPAARDKKEYGLMGEKRDAAFHLRVFRYAPDRTVFSAAVNKFQQLLKQLGILHIKARVKHP